LEKLQNLVASSSEGADGQPGAASHGDVAEDALCLESLKSALVSFAQQMANEDEATNRALGKLGAKHLKLGNSPLTICNTGSLACVYYGTALGVLYSAWEADKLEHVWVTETRPLNQGSRLSMWELACLGIPATLVTDSMAATLMAQGLVSCVIVGADRICANGDVANKVGTLGLAVLAHHYELPFYVVAPHATVDLSAASGAAVSIEQRDGREVAGFAASGLILPQTDEQIRALDLLTQSGPCELAIKQGHQMLVDRKGGAYAFDGWFATTVPNAAVYNPAFDITPAELITALVTEKGVFSAIMGTMDFWQESEQL
jgi:S-methyl-5-thioribose-1-phosphate isomerase